MVYEIILKKRFRNKLNKVLIYLENEFGYFVAKRFATLLDEKLKTISKYPFIGQPSNSFPQVRSFIAGKNRVYYRIEKEKIVVINMYDMRIIPSRNKLK